MGIQVSVTIYGQTIGRELANDPEELAYALEGLSSCDAEVLGAEIVEYGPHGSGPNTAAWLRQLADAIYPPSKSEGAE